MSNGATPITAPELKTEQQMKALAKPERCDPSDPRRSKRREGKNYRHDERELGIHSRLTPAASELFIHSGSP